MRPTTWVAAVTAFALSTAAHADAPKAGDKAPDVDLAATQIEKVLPAKTGAKTLKLSDLHGKNVVLFFYPKAMTPGCTVESCGFRDAVDKFAALDTVVVGISTDGLDAQQQFTDKEKLTFPLMADPNKTAAKAFGVLRPDGKGAQRHTFVIDKAGVVRKVYTQVAPPKHPDEVLAFIKEMK